MSTLEQIRQRPILIISILGVALLLFILTAVDRPQELFTDSHTVAKVDGEKIDYLEFQKRVEQMQENYQNQGYNDVDRNMLQSQVLEGMIQEALLKKEYKRLGLTVTDNELSKAIIGPTPHPYVLQMVQQMGIADPKMLFEAFTNPSKQGITDPQQIQQLREVWANLEKQTEDMLLASKFQTLLTGSMNANKLDAQNAYEQTTKSWTVLRAQKDNSAIADKDVTVTPDELKAEYDKIKGLFRLTQDTRVLSYVTVSIEPSQKDQDAAKAIVNKGLADLKAKPATEGLADNNAFVINRVSTTASAMNPQLKNKLAQLEADTVVSVSFINNTYTLAKLLGSTSQVDSVLVDMAIVADANMTDSVMAQLNAGVKVADLGDKAQGQDSIWTSLVDPQMAAFKDELTNAEPGSYFAPKNAPQPGMLLRIRNRKAPVTVYDIAQVTYVVEPSPATVEKLNSDLRKFLQTNNTADKFTANAAKAGYTAQDAQVTKATLQLNGLRDSRNVCKWALDADKGEVSGVFTDERSTRLIGAVVVDIYDGDYLPVTDSHVSKFLNERVMAKKKADKLVAQYKGKSNSVAGYARAMGVATDSLTVSFGRGADPVLAANVKMAKKGQLVGPIATSTGATVFQILNESTQARPFNFTQDAQAFNMTQGGMSFQRTFGAVLLGHKKVDYRIQKFYSNQQN